jgi:hypothetical protein
MFFYLIMKINYLKEIPESPILSPDFISDFTVQGSCS